MVPHTTPANPMVQVNARITATVIRRSWTGSAIREPSTDRGVVAIRPRMVNAIPGAPTKQYPEANASARRGPGQALLRREAPAVSDPGRPGTSPLGTGPGGSHDLNGREGRPGCRRPGGRRRGR